MLRHKERDLPLPSRIVQGRRERLGLGQHRQEPRKVAEWAEGRAQGKAEIDGLLTRVARLWQMRQDTERLLEGAHRLAVGRARHGLLTRLPEICQGLVPYLTSQGMVR